MSLPANFKAFGPNCPWNTPIPKNPETDPFSELMINNLKYKAKVLKIDTKKWTIPLFVIDSKNSPKVDVKTTSTYLYYTVDPDENGIAEREEREEDAGEEEGRARPPADPDEQQAHGNQDDGDEDLAEQIEAFLEQKRRLRVGRSAGFLGHHVLRPSWSLKSLCLRAPKRPDQEAQQDKPQAHNEKPKAALEGLDAGRQVQGQADKRKQGAPDEQEDEGE